ncbi:S9 family peptidase [Thermoflexibacter ruber]|uniref:Dipeptidyl aminopeptidase/acylaminoacyl peptidase n=1 Tax=Thermoflexibacter ruber TaxID=1003 RepID=A0A1I2IFX8_9BACT|nr:S9 family peptidase [Thermoflexibacter ruber]SFF41215.1 Dipeptidyl aminopeptidase/acylaminoacyl peptidase [Thermoflexibacter ruber]
MKKTFSHFYLLISLFVSFQAFAQEGATVSFEKFISLRSVGSPSISPDGQHVAFTVSTTDWKENQFDSEIWLSKNGEKPFQLTRTTKGGSGQIRWSPDSQWLAFTADRGNKAQIHVIRISGGEAQAVTNEDEGISSFEWTPDGKKFVFTMSEKESKSEKSQKERYGAWAEEDTEYRLSHLWIVDFMPDLPLNELPCIENKKDSTNKQDCIILPKAERLTEGKFTVGGFGISPDGTKIAFAHQPNPLINTSFKSDISVLDLQTKKISVLVQNPSNDNFVTWSPDSKSILYFSNESDTVSNYYKNNKVFRLELASNKSEQILTDIDENVGNVNWLSNGIYFIANQKTKRFIYQLDAKTNKSKAITGLPEYVFTMSFSKDGSQMAFSAQTPATLGEIYKTNTSVYKPMILTEMTKQIADWKVGTAEVISWKSQDGVEIEGVLHKPKNYDPKKKYPLLVVIHGGPTGIDYPTPVTGYVYPILQWVEKGALVLRPNYRGSAGYGEKFRSLNVRNLGVGDMWDVMSGIDYLDKQGMIDTEKMGAMGWSQGGYISAFLTTNTNRFKAISVGAGISNWITYYVNTDIHPFTRQYLQNNPWKDMDIYLKTSPMTNIKNASTPTLIQHGEFDRRVPIPNAYELYQGLQDMNVPTKLVVYKGFGHGITKPKERLAAIWHNWQWFNKYIWGENVEIPMDK